MKKQRWVPYWLFARLFIFLLVVIALVGQHMAKGEMNPVIEEMAALDLAFKTIIGAVILGDMEVIHPALSKVREAREGLEGAVKTGYQISLPKNQNRLGEFFRLDSQFHIDLAELSAAAETGQKKVIRNLTHKLLDECVGCHERFRK